jgi:hypothetical protein
LRARSIAFRCQVRLRCNRAEPFRKLRRIEQKTVTTVFLCNLSKCLLGTHSGPIKRTSSCYCSLVGYDNLGPEIAWPPSMDAGSGQVVTRI